MILGIETSAQLCGVGLCRRDGTLVASAQLDLPRSHARALAPLIRTLLDAAKIAPTDLEAVAVSAGPGSYTGLRIGASMAKGLAFAADAALVSLPTLHVLAQAAAQQMTHESTILASLKSRRHEVYIAQFHSSGDRLTLVQPDAALLLGEFETWLEHTDHPIVLAGDANAVLAEHLARLGIVAKASWAPGDLDLPRHVAQLGAQAFEAGDTVDVGVFEPAYLKPVHAVRGRSVFERL